MLTWHLKEARRRRISRHGATEVAIDIGVQQVAIDALGKGGASLGHLLRVHDLLRLRLLALHPLLVDLVVVDLAHLVHNVLVLEGDEAEAAVALRRLVEHQHRVVHFAVLAEVGLDIFA